MAILDVNRVETLGYTASPVLFNLISGVLLDFEVLSWLP